MAHRFALHLDNEAVALHRVSGSGVEPSEVVAEAPLDSAAFDATLAAMRAEVAEATGNGRAPVEVVLPDSQVLFTQVPASGLDATADAARVRTAIEGATPYEFHELRHDWRAEDGTLHIAVVALETLDEARGFLQAHGFDPAGYVAAASQADFPGRPTFSDSETDPSDQESPDAPVPAVSKEDVPEEEAAAPTAEPEADDAVHKTTFSSIRATAPAASAPSPAQDRGADPDPEAPKSTPEPDRTPSKAVAIEAGPAAERSAESLVPNSAKSKASTSQAAPKATGTKFADRFRRAAPVPEMPPEPGESASPARPELRAETGAAKPPAQSVKVAGVAPPKPSKVPALGRVGGAKIAGRQGSDDPLSADTDAPRRSATAAEPDNAQPVGVSAAAAPAPAGSRRFGLMLTLGLIAVMAAVALGSLWFGPNEPSRPVAEAPASDPTSDPPNASATPAASDEIARAATQSSTLDSTPATPSAEPSGTAMRPQTAPAPSPPSADRAPAAAPAPPPLADSEATGASEADTAALSTAEPSPSDPTATSENDGAPSPAAETEADSATAARSDPTAESPLITVVPAPLDPTEAAAAYAVSGIWQRAPEIAPVPATPSRAQVAPAAFEPPSSLPSARLADPTPRTGSLATPAPSLPTPPLPPGSRLGADGLVVPTPEGALAPGGYTLFTGPPEIIPPRRPGAGTPGGAAQPDADTAAPAESGPSLRPRARPPVASGLSPNPGPDGSGPETGAAETDGTPAAGTDDEATAQSPASEPAAGGVALTAFVRPPARPSEAEIPQAGEPAELAAEDPADGPRAGAIVHATRLAVTQALAPRTRPSNLPQLAARARAAQQAAQERQAAARAAATPERTSPQAVTAAAPPPDSAARGPAVARSQRVSPEVPSSTLVARQATERNALRLNRVTLIGVYGSPNQRRALVRLPSGRYLKVQVGDRLDGGQVAAIDRDAVRYVKSGRNHVIEMPSS